MSDEWRGVGRDEYETDRLLSTQDWSDWRAARGWETGGRPTRAEMIARFATERAEVERESLEAAAERAVVHDGWATYPNELYAAPLTFACERCGQHSLLLEPHPPAPALCAECGQALDELDELRSDVAKLLAHSHVTRIAGASGSAR